MSFLHKLVKFERHPGQGASMLYDSCTSFGHEIFNRLVLHYVIGTLMFNLILIQTIFIQLATQKQY